jgi:hypothetical protein
VRSTRALLEREGGEIPDRERDPLVTCGARSRELEQLRGKIATEKLRELRVTTRQGEREIPASAARIEQPAHFGRLAQARIENALDQEPDARLPKRQAQTPTGLRVVVTLPLESDRAEQLSGALLVIHEALRYSMGLDGKRVRGRGSCSS